MHLADNVQRGFRIAMMARDCGDLLACGGVGLFHKRQHRQPVSLAELVVRTRALARRKPAARHRTLRAAGIELDPLTHAAARDGHTLDLSAKEFTVLEALLNASPYAAAFGLVQVLSCGIARSRRGTRSGRRPSVCGCGLRG